MAMPKGWKPPAGTTTAPQITSSGVNLIPANPTWGSRRMVDFSHIRTLAYHAAIAKVSVTQTGGKAFLSRIDNLVNQLQIHPIESYHSLYLADGKSQPFFVPKISIVSIASIKIISQTKGLISKKQDLMLEIIFSGTGNQLFTVIVDVLEQDVNAIMNELQRLIQIQSNSNYWTRNLLTTKTSQGMNREIEIYPLIPFLADGEQMIWENRKLDQNEKITSIDVVTNYRIFQYSYERHSGSALLFPILDNAMPMNETSGRGTDFIGNYYLSSYYSIGESESHVIGDIEFVASGKPTIIFKQISDPQRLALVTKKIKEESIKTQKDENRNKIENSQQQEVETSPIEARVGQKNSSTNMICDDCGSANPLNSQFCNKCGRQLLPKCNKCRHTNPVGALFCSQCGSKLNILTPDSTSPTVSKSTQSTSVEQSISEDNFLEYTLPNYDLKINYPTTWTLIDKDFTDQFTKVIFLSPKEDPNDSFLDGLGIAVQDLPPNTTIKDCVEVNIKDLQQHNADFSLLESTSTTLMGMSAHQLVYTDNGFKTLWLGAVRGDRAYYLIYRAQSNKYVKFLSVAQQMITSVELIN